MHLFLEKLRKVWIGWEVRGLILVSLVLQIILIMFGSRRKFTASVMVRFLVWSAYMIADSVATFALGNIGSSQSDNCDNKLSESSNVLQAFWAPFLLLHLAGPDTITAYALEDNELWIRHFLVLVVQVGVAFYVFFRSWSDNALTFIAIPMFITGIIKYGERTLVLRSSSADKFKHSLLSFPLFDPPSENNYIVQAYFLFKRSACLFSNMIIDYYGRNDPSYTIINNKQAEEAFKVVEAELGFLFDVLYTKATIVYSRFGIFLRCISFFSSFCALIVFSIIIDIHSYPIADISLTYLLLVSAVFLEVYALILSLLSDWTKVWLIKLKTVEYKPKFLFHLLRKVVQHFPSVINPCKRPSRSMAQYNLISSCLKEKSATAIGVFIRDLVGEMVDLRYLYLPRKEVDKDLQEAIFKHLQHKSKKIMENFDDYIGKSQLLKELLDRRGDFVIEEMNLPDKSKWSAIEVDFDHSLLAWHIATNLCYYPELKPDNDTPPHSKRNISKCLSDYMVYLLVFCPSMLSKGVSFEKKYEDTCNAIKSGISIQSKGKSDEKSQMATACEDFLENVKDDRGADDMSVLHVGCKLAKRLRSNEIEDKWEMISEVWIEMLTYAANRCAWKEHGQQLRNGGELLTHISLLMTHLGLSEQYEMKKTSILALPDREWNHLL
ncbi:hypothetical protein Ddye_031421 [Dipteronia dyeriana]|uniref:DUF4220 domain-containing protein n=1 Tax=Dipteronia dyeriana TaxID=168575 RepID=A0AAD9WMC1_9ROSI|nr:hypothetical protein Ddye_031421 [Dipteronia dyeriana]